MNYIAAEHNPEVCNFLHNCTSSVSVSRMRVVHQRLRKLLGLCWTVQVVPINITKNFVPRPIERRPVSSSASHSSKIPSSSSSASQCQCLHHHLNLFALIGDTILVAVCYATVNFCPVFFSVSVAVELSVENLKLSQNFILTSVVNVPR